MTPTLRTLFIAAAALAAATGAQAGTVAVNFVNPASYTDIGFNEASRSWNLDALGQQFTRLGARLPDNATLRVDVLDVDLAGKPAPRASLQHTYDVRIARPIDWPRMHLRYTLEVNGRPQGSGDEWVQDQNFLRNSNYAMEAERRMLSRWFNERFVVDLRASR